MTKRTRAKKHEEDEMDDLLSDRLTLRVDPETRREWKAQAKEEHRALSNWVVWMVEQARKKQDPRDS